MNEKKTCKTYNTQTQIKTKDKQPFDKYPYVLLN